MHAGMENNVRTSRTGSGINTVIVAYCTAATVTTTRCTSIGISNPEKQSRHLFKSRQNGKSFIF
jgi:hypothetical protein